MYPLATLPQGETAFGAVVYPSAQGCRQSHQLSLCILMFPEHQNMELPKDALLRLCPWLKAGVHVALCMCVCSMCVAV